jgi:hypothetical protein
MLGSWSTAPSATGAATASTHTDSLRFAPVSARRTTPPRQVGWRACSGRESGAKSVVVMPALVCVCGSNHKRSRRAGMSLLVRARNGVRLAATRAAARTQESLTRAQKGESSSERDSPVDERVCRRRVRRCVRFLRAASPLGVRLWPYSRNSRLQKVVDLQVLRKRLMGLEPTTFCMAISTWTPDSQQ